MSVNESLLWQLNEAVSLLREARQFITNAALAVEIDEALPAMQAALHEGVRQ